MAQHRPHTERPLYKMSVQLIDTYKLINKVWSGVLETSNARIRTPRRREGRQSAPWRRYDGGGATYDHLDAPARRERPRPARHDPQKTLQRRHGREVRDERPPESFMAPPRRHARTPSPRRVTVDTHTGLLREKSKKEGPAARRGSPAVPVGRRAPRLQIGDGGRLRRTLYHKGANRQG